MEATRKTSCCNANAGSKVWLWQMLNVDEGRGESSLLLLLYNSSYNLLHRQTPFPPMAGLQPRSLLLPVRVDACWLASGFCISLLFSLHHFILNSLYIFSLIDLLAEAAQQPHSQRPPIKRVVCPTLLFGRHPFLSSGFLSCSVYSLWSGKAACFGPGGLIKWCMIQCWHFVERQITISNQIALLLSTVVRLKSMFELFNISLWSVLTKVAKHELCEGKQKLVLGEMFKFGFRHKREISLLF